MRSIFIVAVLFYTSSCFAGWSNTRQVIWINFTFLLPFLTNSTIQDEVKKFLPYFASQQNTFMHRFKNNINSFNQYFYLPAYEDQKEVLIKMFCDLFEDMQEYFTAIDNNVHNLDYQFLTTIVKKKQFLQKSQYYTIEECTYETFLKVYNHYKDHFLALKKSYDKLTQPKTCSIL